MTDTPAEIGRLVREKMMSRSGEERLIMGAEMFEAARELVMASFPSGISVEEQKRRLFKRFYAKELPEEF